MKPTIILALACTATLGMSTVSLGEDRPVGSASGNIVSQAEIKGEVLKVDGDNFVVKDERSNKEVTFKIGKDVKAGLERPPKQGDRIYADLTPEGEVKAIRLEGNTGKEIPSATGGRQDQRGTGSPEGANPTLSPDGKGSASGG